MKNSKNFPDDMYVTCIRCNGTKYKMLESESLKFNGYTDSEIRSTQKIRKEIKSNGGFLVINPFYKRK